MILTGENRVWSIGGMILTGQNSMEHWWNDTDRGKQSMVHWWNDTDRGNRTAGRKMCLYHMVLNSLNLILHKVSGLTQYRTPFVCIMKTVC